MHGQDRICDPMSFPVRCVDEDPRALLPRQRVDEGRGCRLLTYTGELLSPRVGPGPDTTCLSSSPRHGAPSRPSSTPRGVHHQSRHAHTGIQRRPFPSTRPSPTASGTVPSVTVLYGTPTRGRRSRGSPGRSVRTVVEGLTSRVTRRKPRGGPLQAVGRVVSRVTYERVSRLGS